MIDRIKKMKIILVFVVITLGFLLILSLFNILNLLTSTPSAILSMLFGGFILFIAGFINGKKRIKNGYVAGIITGLIFISILFLISIFIFRVPMNMAMFIYYIILFLSSIIGSMVGINKKKPS